MDALSLGCLKLSPCRYGPWFMHYRSDKAYTLIATETGHPRTSHAQSLVPYDHPNARINVHGFSREGFPRYAGMLYGTCPHRFAVLLNVLVH